MKNRIPLGNRKSRIAKFDLSKTPTWDAFVSQNEIGIYLDSAPNNELYGDNVGVSEIGTPLTQETLLSPSVAESLGLSGDNATVSNAIASSGVKIGDIVLQGYESTDPNFRLCDGSAVTATEYPELYAKIGTRYGAGGLNFTFTKHLIDIAPGVEGFGRINDVAHDETTGTWVAVGQDYASPPQGFILSSNNGIDWTLRYRGAGNTKITQVVFADSLGWIAIGNSGSSMYSAFYASNNAIDWTLEYTTTTQAICTGLCWAAGTQKKLVATMNSTGLPRVYTSTTGRGTWTAGTQSGVTSMWNGITFSAEKNLYIIVGLGANDRGMIWSSPDATTWTARLTVATNDTPFSKAFYAAGLDKFFATGTVLHSNGINNGFEIYSSANGTTGWARVTGTGSTGSEIQSKILGGQWISDLGILLLCGYQGASSTDPFLLSSKDGITFTRENQGASNYGTSLKWSSKQRLCVMGAEADSTVEMNTSKLSSDTFKLPPHNAVVPLAYIRAK